MMNPIQIQKLHDQAKHESFPTNPEETNQTRVALATKFPLYIFLGKNGPLEEQIRSIHPYNLLAHTINTNYTVSKTTTY